jgi:hypothetical protein
MHAILCLEGDELSNPNISASAWAAGQGQSGQPAVCLPRRNAVVALAENGAPDFTVATAIALFGFQSGAALSTVVDVQVEVPVMLSVVHLLRRSRGWYERADSTR